MVHKRRTYVKNKKSSRKAFNEYLKSSKSASTLMKEDAVEFSSQEKKSFFKKSLKYVGKHKSYLIFAFLFMIVGNLLDLFIPVYIGKSIDAIVGAGNVNFNAVIEYLLIIGLIVVADSIITWFYNLFSNIYTFKTSEHIRNSIFEKFNKVPLSYIDRTTHGDLLNRMVNNVETVTDGLVEAVISVSSGAITIIGTLVFMLVLNVRLAIIVAILTPLSLVFAYVIAKKANILFNTQAKKTGELSGYLEELISSQRVVKAFNREDESLEKFDKINEDLEVSAEKAVFYSSMAPPFTRFVNGFVYVAVGLAGGLLALSGKISIGVISSFLSYASSYGKPFNEIANEITEFQAAYSAAQRVFEILDQQDEPSDAGFFEPEFCDGSVKLENVSFSYTTKVKLIEGLNLDVKPGQKIAIVGPTGCGKSTLINLLMRFYDVNSGTISVSGYNISEITRQSLRRKYGMVLQDSWLFHGTIKENIAYGNVLASQEEIEKAAKMAGAHEFIEKLPKGYDTDIAEGGNNISQGQKQLLCIARIMLIDPSMLILDEATSNIDTRTELKIQEAFNTIMNGRTSFIVAHRLSTIKSADVILVMNKGNIIEQGTHEELLKMHGFYYNLYNSQFAKDEA